MTRTNGGNTTLFLTRVSLSLLYDTENVWFFWWHRVKSSCFVSICSTGLLLLLLLPILQLFRNEFSCPPQRKIPCFVRPQWEELSTWAGMLLFVCAHLFGVGMVAEQSTGRTISPGTYPSGTAGISVGKATIWQVCRVMRMAEVSVRGWVCADFSHSLVWTYISSQCRSRHAGLLAGEGCECLSSQTPTISMYSKDRPYRTGLDTVFL